MKLDKSEGIIAIGAKITKYDGLSQDAVKECLSGEGLLLARMDGFSSLFYYEGNSQGGSVFRSEIVDQIIVEDKEDSPQVMIGCHSQPEKRILVPSHIRETQSSKGRSDDQGTRDYESMSQMDQYKMLLSRSRHVKPSSESRQFDAGSLNHEIRSESREVEVKPVRIQFKTIKAAVIKGLNESIDVDFLVEVAIQAEIIEPDWFVLHS